MIPKLYVYKTTQLSSWQYVWLFRIANFNFKKSINQKLCFTKLKIIYILSLKLTNLQMKQIIRKKTYD